MSPITWLRIIMMSTIVSTSFVDFHVVRRRAQVQVAWPGRLLEYAVHSYTRGCRTTAQGLLNADLQGRCQPEVLGNGTNQDASVAEPDYRST